MQCPTPHFAKAQHIAHPQRPGLVTESTGAMAIDMKLQAIIFPRQAGQ